MSFLRYRPLPALGAALCIVALGHGAAEPKNEASIRAVGRLQDLPPGAWTEGDFGDWRIACGGSVAIVGAIRPDPYDEAATTRMGAILDVARLDDPYDELNRIESAVYLGSDNFQLVRFKTAALSDRHGKGRSLLFTGEVEGAPGLRVENELLPATDNVLRLTLSATNESTATLCNVGLGDRVDWGGLGLFVERFGAPDSTALQVAYSSWVGGRIDQSSAGIVVPRGQMEGLHFNNVSSLRYATAPSLAPGERVEATRYLFIGNGEFSRLSDYALTMRNDPHGTLKGMMWEAGSTTPIPGVDMGILVYTHIEDPTTSAGIAMSPHVPYTLARTDAKGEFSAMVPSGYAYPLAQDFSRYGQKPKLAPAIAPGAVENMGMLQMLVPSRLHIVVKDARSGAPLPCKVQVRSIAKNAFFNYGPPYRARGARNTWYLPRGDDNIPLPIAGRYQLVVSRGPEYTISDNIIVDAKPGQLIEKTVTLERVVDTKGYVAVDLGVQTSASPDCRTSPRDLVAAAACEGVEWLVSADYNKATDLAPAITAEGLRPWLGATRGLRAIPEDRRSPANFSVFPAAYDLDPVTVFPTGDDDPSAALGRLRAKFPSSLLCLNTPYDFAEGYLKNYDFNSATLEFAGGRTPALDFDLYEILDGRRHDYQLAQVESMGGLMRLGRRVIPVGASSSRTLYGGEPGWARVYVGVPNDDPAKVTEADIVAGLRKGDVMVTNGPFIRVRAGDKGPGGLVPAVGGKVAVEFEIWAPPWMEVSDFQVRKDTQFERLGYLALRTTPQRYPDPEGKGPKSLEISAKTDVSLYIYASGERTPLIVLPEMKGRSDRSFPPFAVSGPIYIDGDGDGKFTPPPGGKPRG